MKKTILISFIAGLILAGCNKSKNSEQATAATKTQTTTEVASSANINYIEEAKKILASLPQPKDKNNPTTQEIIAIFKPIIENNKNLEIFENAYKENFKKTYTNLENLPGGNSFEEKVNYAKESDKKC